MTWTCPRCETRYPDSGGERGDGCLDCTEIVARDDLYELYSTLADATEAASIGDPNTVAAKAADAKQQVTDLGDGDE